MSVKPFVSFVFACVAAVALVLVPADSSHAITKCKVKVGKKTGVIQVEAIGVAGPLLWGGQSGGVDNSFFNDATCVASGRARRCTLADPATIDSKIPPAGCTIHLDDGDTPCSVWVKGCTPGPRVVCLSQVGDDVFFEGCNVHVRSGSGATNGDTGAGASVNGLGNLIVGYNEGGGFGADGFYGSDDDKSGSHNLVVGPAHSYSSYGGLVAGEDNNVSARAASVSGGGGNIASGYMSSVSGGYENTASGESSSVSGGTRNIANSGASSVSGGEENTASDSASSVSGGHQNIAGRICTSGLVGKVCTTSLECDASLGAGDGVCLALFVSRWSSVSGGNSNTASSEASSVSGGSGNDASESYSSVSGGIANMASGPYSSVSGGDSNTASGQLSSVSGGWDNIASGVSSSVSGGKNNTASGNYSSVSGGGTRTAAGQSDWAAGSLSEDF